MAFLHASNTSNSGAGPNPSSPHTLGNRDTQRVMLSVFIATLPGLLALTYWFGFGNLMNVFVCALLCLGIEALILQLRQRPILPALKDGSALVTAILLGIALPPYAPGWLLLMGSLVAIGLAKQLYGGLGYNPFNPAMVAYVVLLISFPVEMTQWAAASNTLAEGQQLPSLMDAISRLFGAGIDGYTGATPLDAFKQNTGEMASSLFAREPVFANAWFAGAGWEWANLGFLIGGLWLLQQRIFTWHAPIAMLASLSLMAMIFYDGGSNQSGASPLLHLFSGATMLGAFFILTDPVSSAVSNRGRLIFGAGVGILVYVIRQWGNYPDAVAFAVLLMNFAAPFIDYYTVPRTYGHRQARSVAQKKG